MSDAEGPGDQAGASRVHLAPIGKLGFRGRRATPKEQAQIMDAFFFEGGRRVPYLQQFFVLMVLSAAIAAFGLANDSAAVVIGAMLVAPLMTPILAVAAAIVQGWGRRAVESLAIITAGAISAIAVSFVIALFTPSLHTELPLPGELLARTAPNMIDLFIALAAGAAGGFVAVRTEASGALPGVGIAVALVPPLATVGITAGLGRWDLSAGALLLFLTNLVAIILGSAFVFKIIGVRGRKEEQRQPLWARRMAMLLILATIGLIVPLENRFQAQIDSGHLGPGTYTIPSKARARSSSG